MIEIRPVDSIENNVTKNDGDDSRTKDVNTEFGQDKTEKYEKDKTETDVSKNMKKKKLTRSGK